MPGVLCFFGKTLTSSTNSHLRSYHLIRQGPTLLHKANISKKKYKWPEIDDKDLEEDLVRGGGPGGQSVAKTSNCVVLKHKPTGIVVRAHDTRSQFENRKHAIERLKYHLDIHFNKENSFDAISKREQTESNRKKKEQAKKLLELKKAFKARKKQD